MAFDSLISGKLSKRSIAGEEYPFSSLRQRKSKAVRNSENRGALAVGKRPRDHVAVEFFDDKAETKKIITAEVLQLALIQKIGHGKLVGQAETGLQQRPALQIDKNGCVGDQDPHRHQAPLTA